MSTFRTVNVFALSIRNCRIWAVAVIVYAGYPSTALAYLDPGTGSMILQGILAAIAAGGFVLSSYWGRFKAWFGGNSKADDDYQAKGGQGTKEDQP